MLYNIICFYKKEYKGDYKPLYYVFVDKYPFKFKVDSDTYDKINGNLTELNILPGMVKVTEDKNNGATFKLNL